jgi:hypothetical protein
VLSETIGWKGDKENERGSEKETDNEGGKKESV